jgi:hypothetical protein
MSSSVTQTPSVLRHRCHASESSKGEEAGEQSGEIREHGLHPAAAKAPKGALFLLFDMQW